jgi:hypothetical protein
MLFEECRNAGMPECRNTDKKFSPALFLFTVSFPGLVRHRHSGIVVSPVPVPLVTD